MSSFAWNQNQEETCHKDLVEQNIAGGKQSIIIRRRKCTRLTLFLASEAKKIEKENRKLRLLTVHSYMK